MCRLLALSTATLLLVAGVLPRPAIGGPIVNGGILDISPQGDQCVEFTGHYCNRFNNRTTAFFPNPRGHETLEEAAAEFAHFLPLFTMQDGPCHEKLGTLLCFIYFPFCENAYPSVRIYPCQELCEEVHNSSCTEIINSHATWNTQLQCNHSVYKPRSSLNCADGVAPPYRKFQCG